VQGEDLDAAGERLAEAGQEEEIGGAGEEETAGAAIAVNGELDRTEELRDALDLVERHRVWQRGDEACGVVAGGAEESLVVEADVVSAGDAELREGALAALPRAEERDDGGVRQRLGEAGM